ncbi:MAG: hypothetical protein LCH54_13830 [Bacteroidetes bacterium]|nr:hypothetical protein [Bacteroidota bacterium]
MTEIEDNNIEDFDIIVSKGQSVLSLLTNLMQFSTSDYSHVGIVIRKNKRLYVLHSTPDGTNLNGIRFDDLQTFFDLSDVSDFVILRHKDITVSFQQRLKVEFSRYLTIKAPFDFDFNNLENSRIYCSELVWLIYKNAGLLKTKDFDLINPISPKYFLTLKSFNRVPSTNVHHASL